MKLHPYLIYSGQAEKAIHFYCKTLGFEHTEMKRYKDTPMPHSDTQKEWIIHCELTFKGKLVAMVADTEKVESGTQIQLSLNYNNLETMKEAFYQLSKGGQILEPLKKQFWNATFGQLIDPFGVYWMMNFDPT
ncbi:MAG: glyoxalase/bleomycin resistance/extradiol dioxygenase family protein [Flavobacteriaceae bacterium]